MNELTCDVCMSKLEIVENHSYVDNDGFIDGWLYVKCPNCGIDFYPDAEILTKEDN